MYRLINLVVLAVRFGVVMDNTAASPYGEYFSAYATALSRRSKVRRRLVWAGLFAILLVTAAGTPLWWHLHQLDVRRAWERELQEYVSLTYSPSPMASALLLSDWIPVSVAKWYQERSQVVTVIDYGPLAGRALPTHLAEKVITSPWPNMHSILHVDGNCWDGVRWLLPHDVGPVMNLSLNGIGLYDEALTVLPLYTQLRRFDLSQNPLGDRGLAYVANLPDLEQLFLHETKITDAGLKSLVGCTRLAQLTLGDTPIQGGGLRHLAGMTRLTSLSLARTELSDEWLRRLPNLPALQAIDLSGTKIDGSGLAWGWEPTRLESMNLSGAPVRSETLALLRRFKALRTLSLEGTAIRAAGLEHLVEMPLLTSVQLGRSAVDDEGARRLTAAGTAGAIKYLTLSETRITDASGIALRKLTGVENVVVDKTAVGDAFVAGLAGQPTIGGLSLAHTRVTNACVPSLSTLPALKYLDVRGTAMTEEGLEPLRARGVKFASDLPPPRLF